MQHEPAPRAPLVWARASVLGGAVLLSGAVPHVAAGGRLPGLATLLVLLAVAVVAGSRLLTAWAGPTRLVAFVVVAQGVVHAAQSVLAGHRGDPAVPVAVVPIDPGAHLATADRQGSLQDVYEAGLGATPAPGHDVLAHQWAHLVEQGPWMALGHAVGAVALALFLARGERALSTLLLLAVVTASAWLVVRVRTHVTVPVPSRPRVRPVLARLVRTSQVVGSTSRSLRGPPELLVA